MKIYQLHEHSGEYEDYRDRIVGSYLRKERAEEEKIKSETKEKEMTEHSKRCLNCPFVEFDDTVNINDLLIKYPNYCSESKLRKDEYGIECDNYYTHWDRATFKIEEVEVEE